jgi:hypothetical protein
VNKALVDDPDFVSAITIASKHHAVTSSLAAEAIDSTPNGVFAKFLSCTILANTGKAVILIDIPMNKAKAKNDVCCDAYFSYM